MQTETQLDMPTIAPAEKSAITTTPLDAKVVAQNEANRIAMAIQPHLLDLVRPFIGKTIVKKNGWNELYKNAQAAIGHEATDQLMSECHLAGPGVSLRISGYRDYRLSWDVNVSRRATENDRSYQAAASVWVGKIENHVLVGLHEWQLKLRTDFTAEEIRVLRFQRNQAEEQMRELESKLNDFGRFDQ